MSNDDDRDPYFLDPMETARFLANELAVMANELERALAMSGSAQKLALGTAVNMARANAHWAAERDNLAGPAQALMELAKRMAWREANVPKSIAVADIPRLLDLSQRAQRIERRRFLSQYSEAIGAFKAAMAELDRDWDYENVRPGFLRIISGGRAD